MSNGNKSLGIFTCLRPLVSSGTRINVIFLKANAYPRVVWPTAKAVS